MNKPTSILFNVLCITVVFVIGIAIASAIHNSQSTTWQDRVDHRLESAGILPTETTSLQIVPLRDYQIELIEDSMSIYDGKHLVGKLPINWDKPTAIDSLIIEDNR